MDVRVAAYAVIVRDSQILLAHLNFLSRRAWTLPGGGLNPGEHPEKAVVREVAEETGFEARVDRLLGVDSAVIPAHRRPRGSGKPMHALRIIYQAHVTGGELVHEANGTTDQAKWFGLDEIRSLDTVQFVKMGLELAGF